MNLGKLFDMFRAFRAGAPLGDVVMLKLDALSTPTQAANRKLERLSGYAAPHDLSHLRTLPSGTLGRAYATFLDDNGIVPLVVSENMKRRFKDRPYALRYTATHDLHHVLTGFDTGLAGEVGVLAFNVGQGAAPVGQSMLWIARLVFCLIAPTQARTIWHNIHVGLELGRKADLVIAEPLESYFEEPLAEVRSKLHIPDPRSAGVLASGSSLVGNLLYPSKQP